VKLSYLVKGLPGHPLHPPLTDATIGAYTVAAVLAFFSKIGVSSHATATGWWLALLVALAITGLTALTGLIDWLGIEWWTPLWKTATLHMLTMLAATAVFLAALLWGHAGYTHAAVRSGPFVLTLLGFVTLTVGGWLGGTVVFVHGMRVLSLVDEPTGRAVSPVPKREKENAERA
jgi:uncharacterized membrane protein